MSNASLATKRALHQPDAKPPGLVGVTLAGTRSECRVVAGVDVTISLRQVGVVVTQVEGEHLPGEAQTDVPGRVVSVRDTPPVNWVPAMP